jgi:cell division protein ZapA (FtsZ GTPase activity inhibitor)
VTQKRTVPVTIQGRHYRIRADGDVGSVERAAVLLDETMTKVRARSGTADSVDVAVLAALNLANALTADRTGHVTSRDLEQRIEALVDLVEMATAEPGAAAS